MDIRVEKRRDELLGKEFETNTCGKCFIIDYKGRNQVTVMFYDPVFVVNCQMHDLGRGKVGNPFYRTVFDVGYVGVGKYKTNLGVVHTREHALWVNMLTRVYDYKSRDKYPTYKDVTVCKEWLNFQNFAAWCHKQEFFNVRDENGKVYQLDKDILTKDSKVYSPETCCFVPQEVNKLLLKSDSIRGGCPIGVCLVKASGKFQASVKCGGIQKYLGVYKTPDEAFEVYKAAKEAYIKEVAERFKHLVDASVYEALKKIKVDKTS